MGGFWRRNAWKFLLGLVILIGLFGIGDMARGVEADPAIPLAVTGMTIPEMEQESAVLTRMIDLQVRAGGNQLLALSVAWATIVVIPYRRGERWAWYAMLTYPGWALSVAVSFLFIELQPGVAPPPPAISGWVLAALALALMLASRPERSV